MQLTIELPDDLGHHFRQFRDPGRFIGELLTRLLREEPGLIPSLPDARPSERAGTRQADAGTRTETRRRNLGGLSKQGRQRWRAMMRSALDVQGVPLGAEAVQAMSRECGLEENELSRSVIEAREE